MINLIVVSHGALAHGLLDAMRLIAGEQEGISSISLTEEDSIDELPGRILAAAQQINQGDGVVVLVDLIGASPFNVTSRLAMENSWIRVVTGVNLPMLLETAFSRDGLSLDEVARIAQEAGANGVKTLEQLLNQID